MKQGSGSELAKRVSRMLREFVSQTNRGDGLVAFNTVGNRADSVAAFKERAGQIPILIRSAVFEALLLTVARLCDKAESNSDSVASALNLLSDDLVLSQWQPPIDPDAIEAIKQDFGRLQSDSRLSRLMAARNYRSAHLLETKWQGTDWPEIDHLISFWMDLRALLDRLFAVASIYNVSHDAVLSVWMDRAEDYWLRLVKTGPQEPANL
jgi:hypothetical protein